MAVTKLTDDLNIITALSQKPNATDGLNSAQLQAKFDEAGNDIKTYINNTLTVEIDTLDGANVKLTGAQTVAGVKTFSSSPVVPTPTTGTQSTNKDYVDTGSPTVKLTGDQTVAGIKTFSSSPIVPEPTTDLQVSTKKYVDDSITGVVLGQIPDKSLTPDKVNDDMFFLDQNYFTTTNIGNDYSITSGRSLASITAGMTFKIKVNADATGNTTLNVDTLGAVNILKANGTNVANLKNNGVYTLTYNGTNFTLQGEGASGDAVASNLLTGKTATVDAGEITGTMADRSGDTACVSSTVSGTTLKLKASEGYRDGTNDFVTITDTDFIVANIKSGIDIFGITGTLASVKSVQYGSATPFNDTSTTTFDITITEIDLTKSIVIMSETIPASKNGNVSVVAGYLFNSVALRLNRGSSASATTTKVYWMVIEFDNVKSLQRSQQDITTASTNITLSTVNTAKSIVVFNQKSTLATVPTLNQHSMSCGITSSTNIVVEAVANTNRIYFEVIEFN